MDLLTLKKKFAATDIYPVITPEFCAGRPVLSVLESTLKGGARIVQLRDKTDPKRFAADFRRITSIYGALFIVNDSVDLALKYQADGVHLGHTDLSIAQARKLAPQLLIGASVNSLSKALLAQRCGASYVNIGPIFKTQTKSGLLTFLGTNSIKDISPYLNIPFSVIGGINKSNIHKVLRAGARHIAMITCLTEAADVEKTTIDLIKLIHSHPIDN